MGMGTACVGMGMLVNLHVTLYCACVYTNQRDRLEAFRAYP